MNKTSLALAIRAIASPRFACGGFFAAADGNVPTIRPLMVLRPVAETTQYELLVYGDIGDSWWGESVTALSVVQQLQALDAGVTQINVRINSYGGSVSDGLAIYNALKRHSARKVVTVDGVAMSSASLIAMAGDDIQMPATSLLMIHAPWGLAQGNAQDMRVMADVLDTYASTMAGAYAKKTGKSNEDMLALLADGQDHYYTGEQAVAEGFADTLIDGAADQDDSAATADATARAAGVSRLLAGAPDDMRQFAIAAAARHPVALPAPSKPRMRAPTTPSNTPAPVAVTPGDTNMPNANTTATPADPAADEATITARAHEALRTRNADILAAVQPHLAREGVQAILTAALSDPSMTVDTVRQQVLDKIGASTHPIAGNTFETTADESDKFRAAGENAILARAGYAKADGQNPMRGLSLREIARACATRAGKNTNGMDIRDVVATAFTSTSDFPALLTSTARNSLLRGYEEAPESFPLFTRAGTLTDFRPANNAGLGFFSALDKIAEGAEYKYGTFGTAGNAITLATYGKLFAITRQAIINDDLGAFTQVPRKMGRAAKRTIGDLVFAILTGNPTMADGVALFHATHKNLLTGSTIDTANVDAMRVAMATQKFDGQPINVPLKYLVVPMALQGAAETVRSSQYAVTANANTTTPNTVANTFEVIADARLDGSPKVWFGSADPAMYDTIEVAYLDGVQEPFLDQKDGWNVDGTEFKVRIDAGVAPQDFRGLAKNPGA